VNTTCAMHQRGKTYLKKIYIKNQFVVRKVWKLIITDVIISLNLTTDNTMAKWKRINNDVQNTIAVPGENHRFVASHWQSLSHNVLWSTPRLNGIPTHNFSGDSTDCTGSCKYVLKWDKYLLFLTPLSL
jgi:hypothetical protein